MMNRVQERPNNVVEFISLENRKNPAYMFKKIKENLKNINYVSPALWEDYAFPFEVLYYLLSEANNMENKELARVKLKECLMKLKEVSGIDANVVYNQEHDTFKVIRNDKPKNNKSVYENVSYTESSEYPTTNGRPKNESYVKSILNGSRWNNAA